MRPGWELLELLAHHFVGPRHQQIRVLRDGTSAWASWSVFQKAEDEMRSRCWGGDFWFNFCMTSGNRSCDSWGKGGCTKSLQKWVSQKDLFIKLSSRRYPEYAGRLLSILTLLSECHAKCVKTNPLTKELVTCTAPSGCSRIGALSWTRIVVLLFGPTLRQRAGKPNFYNHCSCLTFERIVGSIFRLSWNCTCSRGPEKRLCTIQYTMCMVGTTLGDERSMKWMNKKIKIYSHTFWGTLLQIVFCYVLLAICKHHWIYFRHPWNCTCSRRPQQDSKIHDNGGSRSSMDSFSWERKCISCIMTCVWERRGVGAGEEDIEKHMVFTFIPHLSGEGC